MLPRLLKDLRSLVEQPEAGQKPKEAPKAAARRCPPGFTFDGKHCVSISKQDGERAGNNQEGPPPSGRVDDENDMPHTRPTAKPKDVPLVPDPDSEVMQQPWNRITYANGKTPHDYAGEEWSEYGGNAHTMARFPDAFENSDEFVAAFLHAQPKAIEDWAVVEGSDPSKQKKDDYDGLMAQLWNYKKDLWSEKHGGDEKKSKAAFKDYVDKLIKLAQTENEDTAPPPIVGVHTDQKSGQETRYLMAGNSRAMVYAYLGKPCVVREIPLKGRKLQEPTEEELTKALWPAEATEDPDEREKAVRAAVQQVIQARDTGVPLQAASEMADVIIAFQQALMDEKEPSKRSYPSGYQKRLFRKIQKDIGYPVGTVRTWARGKVVKTPKGWEDMPVTPMSPTGAHLAPPAVHPGKAAKHSPIPEGGHWIDSIPGFPTNTTHKHYEGFNKPRAYRKNLHNQIIGKFYDHVKQPEQGKKPVAIMMMGGPASGKSSLAKGYPDEHFVRLDADAIKEKIPEYVAATKWRARNAAKMVHDESIHIMQQLREKTINDKKNLVMDGTGRHSGSYTNMIDKLKKNGYHVKVVMADNDKDIALQRAKKRGAKTGRWVPEHVFDDAYRTVPRNFHHISKAADDFELWDTRHEDGPKLKWEKTSGKETIHDQKFVDEFHKKHTAPPTHDYYSDHSSHYSASSAPVDAAVPIHIKGGKHPKPEVVHKGTYAPTAHEHPKTKKGGFSWLASIIKGEN